MGRRCWEGGLPANRNSEKWNDLPKTISNHWKVQSSSRVSSPRPASVPKRWKEWAGTLPLSPFIKHSNSFQKDRCQGDRPVQYRGVPGCTAVYWGVPGARALLFSVASSSDPGESTVVPWMLSFPCPYQFLSALLWKRLSYVPGSLCHIDSTQSSFRHPASGSELSIWWQSGGKSGFLLSVQA